MADNLTPITSDQLSKVTTAQDTDLVTLGINGNFVSMTLANLKEVLGINALNTNKADVEDVTSKFNWGTAINYKVIRVGKVVFFQATCTTKSADEMTFASSNVPSLNPVAFTPLKAYTASYADFTKRAEAYAVDNHIRVQTYASYTSATKAALSGNVIVAGCWIIN